MFIHVVLYTLSTLHYWHVYDQVARTLVAVFSAQLVVSLIPEITPTETSRPAGAATCSIRDACTNMSIGGSVLSQISFKAGGRGVGPETCSPSHICGYWCLHAWRLQTTGVGTMRSVV
jgi:hypothetical protein